MGQLHHSACTLRIVGDDLDPDEVTSGLGTKPSSANRKGEVTTFASGRARVHRTGGWSLRALAQEPGDLDLQVLEIVGKTTKDLTVWQDFGNRFQSELFIGLFVNTGDEGLKITSATTKLISERCLSLSICIYAQGAIEAEG